MRSTKMITPAEIVSYAVEDLQEEYTKLFDNYQHLKKSNESNAQCIHDLKRNLDLAEKSQAYLTQELETLTATPKKENKTNKANVEYEELQNKYYALRNDFDTLQKDYENQLIENKALSNELKHKEGQKECEPVKVDALEMERIERLNTLERENLELLQNLEECHENRVRFTITIAEREKKIEILRDQVNCFEENLRSKREELEETVQLLESTQEQLVEANAKIAMLTSAPDNNDRKGNSLFAEVDDQRQAMKQLLLSQKKSYMQMKKIFNESEHEIRRLKRENFAMHTELQACSTIFCNADKIYQTKLIERIQHLLNQNENLEKKLSWTQERLKELAHENGVVWLDSMLNFCKQETDQLKQQLHSIRFQKGSLEEQLRNTQQDMARWRFESLNTRCVLLDRENLLNENKIKFKAVNTFELHLTQTQLENSRPRIVQMTTDARALVQLEQTIPISNDVNDVKIEAIPTPLTLADSKQEQQQETPVFIESVDTKEIVEAASTSSPAQISLLESKETPDRNSHTIVNRLAQVVLDEKSEQSANETLESTLECAKKRPPRLDILPGPSILSKGRDLFGKETSNRVKFCLNASQETAVDSADKFQKAAMPTKATPLKNKIVMRRVVIGTNSDLR